MAHKLGQGSSQNDKGSLLLTIYTIKVVTNLINSCKLNSSFAKIYVSAKRQPYQQNVKFASFYAELL